LHTSKYFENLNARSWLKSNNFALCGGFIQVRTVHSAQCTAHSAQCTVYVPNSVAEQAQSFVNITFCRRRNCLKHLPIDTATFCRIFASWQIHLHEPQTCQFVGLFKSQKHIHRLCCQQYYKSILWYSNFESLNAGFLCETFMDSPHCLYKGTGECNYGVLTNVQIKILSKPWFGREVKPSVPCRLFALCKRSQNGVYVVISAKISGQYSRS
jgi:hypothetical protein